MMLDQTGSWSASDFIPEDRPACWYITQDTEQQTVLYEKNRVSMLLYNAGSRSTGDFIVLVYNT